jgi:hypothetical protein
MQHGPAASSGSNPKAPGSAGGYLLLNINVYMEDAESGKMKFARSVDIRRPARPAATSEPLINSAHPSSMICSRPPLRSSVS